LAAGVKTRSVAESRTTPRLVCGLGAPGSKGLRNPHPLWAGRRIRCLLCPHRDAHSLRRSCHRRLLPRSRSGRRALPELCTSRAPRARGDNVPETLQLSRCCTSRVCSSACPQQQINRVILFHAASWRRAFWDHPFRQIIILLKADARSSPPDRPRATGIQAQSCPGANPTTLPPCVVYLRASQPKDGAVARTIIPARPQSGP